MVARTKIGRRFTVASALLGGALVLAAASRAAAQDAEPDVRWQGWLGCWEPVGVQAMGASGQAGTQLVCVIPAAGASAVDVATVTDGKIVARERVDASGERRSNTKDGCTGWERAQWAPDGRRVYVQSEYTCSGELKRSSNGLLAISSTGDWLDVQGVTVGGSTGVRVTRYREASPATTLPREIAAALEGRALAVNTARTAAMAPLTTDDVVEASRHLSPAVVEAWLIERNQGFGLDARQLVGLADAGVPERVIDLMVALSYPRVFAVNPTSREGDFRPNADPRPTPGARGNVATGPFVMLDPYGFSRFGYSPFGLNYYSPFGSSLYGFGPGFGWYPGGSPAVIVRNPTNAEVARRGRVVNGRGYTQTGGESAARPDRSMSPGGGAGSGVRSGGTASPSGSSAGTGSRSGSSGRTAKPRP